MPVVGNRKSTELGKGYLREPISGTASAFKDLAQNILSESGINIYTSPSTALLESASLEAIKNYFIEESADRSTMSAEEYDEHLEMMNEQFLNDRDAVLEYASVGTYNPVIGMTFPMHKNILMNCIFDKGGIQKAVAREPKFTMSMETRYLVTPDGKEIDMFKEQDKMSKAIKDSVPFKEVELSPLADSAAVDVLAAIGASSLDHISIDCSISAVKVETMYADGETKPDGTVVSNPAGEIVNVWVPVNLKFTPSYGEFDRTLMEPVSLASVAKLNVAPGSDTTDIISANLFKDRFTVMSARGLVKGVKVRVRKDTSNGLTQTCSVKWSQKTDIVEIPEAIPLNTAISPEEVKDIGALFNVNQVSKVMSMIKTVLENYKDDSIKEELDTSYTRLDDSQKIEGKFDFAPRDGYALDHVEWRHKTFFDALDSYVTTLLQVLNDANMTVTIYGRPDLIRKITPTEYTYQSPSSIGPVELEFTKTVVNASDKRVYQFVSSQKIKNDDLIIVLCPRNTERIIYRIYDYQMYVSNEIRNTALHTLPSVHAFERWKFVEYQPVQGRIQILNPTGLK